jgi:hypothetical protein
MADDFDNHYDIPERNYAEEEEAHFYFTVKEFEWLLEEYGCAFVLSKLSETNRNLIKEKLNV